MEPLCPICFLVLGWTDKCRFAGGPEAHAAFERGEDVPGIPFRQAE
jgi:hypothetical protein